MVETQQFAVQLTVEILRNMFFKFGEDLLRSLCESNVLTLFLALAKIYFIFAKVSRLRAIRCVFVLCNFRTKTVVIRLQARGNRLQLVGRFKYLGVLFTSDSRWNKIDTWIDKENAVLRQFYCSVATKQELSNTAKPSGFKVGFDSIFTYTVVMDHWL